MTKRRALSAAMNGGPGPKPKPKASPTPAATSGPKVPKSVQEQIDKQDPSLQGYPVKYKVESATMPGRTTVKTIWVPKGTRVTPGKVISEATAKKYPVPNPGATN